MLDKFKIIEVMDSGIKKKFTIHKYKATESIQVFILLLSCIANTDIEFNDVLGFEPMLLEAWAHLNLQTGVKNDQVSTEDIQKLHEAMQVRKTELIFHIIKLALKSIDKVKIDELMSYIAYAVSSENDKRLTTAGNSSDSIDNFIETPAALLNICREVLEFNFKGFFLNIIKENLK
jgi:hypothetical protein